MATIFPTEQEAHAARKWFVVDATDLPVGRLASRVASVLRGKENPSYTPHTDTGDFVIVVNADKVKFTGRKTEDKVYYRHTGYVGGIRKKTAGELLSEKPEDVVKAAIKGMLPKTVLGRNQLKKLKVYRGADHPHSAQTPEALTF